MELMHEKVCVITGATSGIGRATAITLGRAGANVIAVGRNTKRGKKVVHRIRASPISGQAKFIQCDLSSQQQVRNLSETIHGFTRRIDVLVNNAGAKFDLYQLTEDGIEMTFATNYLSHFLMTALLLDLMMKATEARVINVAGDSHWGGNGHFEQNMNTMESYNHRIAKNNSKLAILMFTYELADRLQGSKITVNAVDPGAVATRFGQNNGLISWMKIIAAQVWERDLISSRKGSDTIVHLAVTPELGDVSGKYFYCRKLQSSSPLSQNKETARSLWGLSMRMTSLNKDIGDSWRIFKP